MRKSMLMPLVSMALCLTAADLATAAGRPASDHKSSFQTQPRAQSVAQTQIVIRPGAVGTIPPAPRRGIRNVNHAQNCSITRGYDSCNHWFLICSEASSDEEASQNCYDNFKICEAHCGRYTTEPEY